MKSYDIYLYGEDGFTLWAVMKAMHEMKSRLKIRNNIENVFYRPSFGRGGGPSCFGEFDAILSTSTTVYLIESKWLRNLNRTIQLSSNQVIRHYIMKSIILNGDYPADLDICRCKRLCKKRKPKEDTLLNTNLKTIIRKLKGNKKKEIRNILLIFSDRTFKYNPPIKCSDCRKDDCEIIKSLGFSCVTLPYPVNNMDNNFIHIV